MQQELEASNPGAVQLLTVNEVGFEASTDQMSILGDLPLLQDTAQTDVWGSWFVTYRDVIILDADNKRVAVYNLTVNDLEDPARYAALKALLQSAISD